MMDVFDVFDCDAVLPHTHSPFIAREVTWDMLGFEAAATYQARDLWEHKDYAQLSSKEISARVQSHGVIMLKLTAK